MQMLLLACMVALFNIFLRCSLLQDIKLQPLQMQHYGKDTLPDLSCWGTDLDHTNPAPWFEARAALCATRAFRRYTENTTVIGYDRRSCRLSFCSAVSSSLAPDARQRQR